MGSLLNPGVVAYDDSRLTLANDMITVNPESHLITVTAFAEFTLSDYQEFEAAALAALEAHQKPNLLFDLRELTGYTLDVAWEEVRFTRNHKHDFPRVAVGTTDQ